MCTMYMYVYWSLVPAEPPGCVHHLLVILPLSIPVNPNLHRTLVAIQLYFLACMMKSICYYCPTEFTYYYIHLRLCQHRYYTMYIRVKYKIYVLHVYVFIQCHLNYLVDIHTMLLTR